METVTFAFFTQRENKYKTEMHKNEEEKNFFIVPSTLSSLDLFSLANVWMKNNF